MLQVPYLLPCNKHQFQHVLLIACLVPANSFMPCLMEVYNSLQAACTKLCMLSHKNLHELRYKSLATALSHFGTRAAVDDAAPDAALNSLPGSLERDVLRFRNHAQSTDGLVANQCPCHRCPHGWHLGAGCCCSCGQSRGFGAHWRWIH